MTDDSQALLSSLEGLLVSEFRAYQNLMELSKSEREALGAADIDRLLSVLDEKEGVMDEIDRLESSRQQIAESWVSREGASEQTPTLASILPRLERGTAARLGRLREGILALAQELRVLGAGNRALADSALERVEAVRYFLLSLDRSPAGYQPPGVQPVNQPPSRWEVERWA